MVVLGRILLLLFGVWPGMLQVHHAEQAQTPSPVHVCAPHVGALEMLVMLVMGMPRAIAMESYAKLPVIYSLFKAAGGIAVPVPSSEAFAKGVAKVAPTPPAAAGGDGGDAAVEAAKRPAAAEKPSTLAVRQAIVAHKKAFEPHHPTKGVPIFILPEGTTHNGNTILRFFSGAFEGGGPVQPTLLSYPYTHFNAAYFGGGMIDHLARLLVNPWQRVEITYLPVYHPTPEEAADAAVFAENVRLAMAAAAGKPASDLGAKEMRKEYQRRAAEAHRRR